MFFYCTELNVLRRSVFCHFVIMLYSNWRLNVRSENVYWLLYSTSWWFSIVLSGAFVSVGHNLGSLPRFAVCSWHCQILSINGACSSLVICAVPTPVKTTPKLSGPAFGVLPKTGDQELEDWGKPGWERLRMICARSTSAWRRQDMRYG